MFMLSECILFLLIVLLDWNILKWLSIFVCFLYAVYQQEGYLETGLIVMADGLLLNYIYIEVGIMIFMIVQCLYHQRMSHDLFFYVLLLVFLCPNLYVLGMVYALMSFINLELAFQTRHWLLITILLLALCDLCVAVQYLFLIDLSMIWWFYLPSQIYFVKKFHQ